MLKKILVAVTLFVLVVVGSFLWAVALQPDTYQLERSTTVAAPASEPFAKVNDFAQWESWNPFSKLDPQAETSISEPSAGPGAMMLWAGNDQVGAGRMTIKRSEPHELVELEQVFTRPMAGKATFTFDFKPVADGTEVTMRMHGTNDFMGKMMCFLVDMEAMLGPEFEKCLAGIKELSEKNRATSEAGTSADPAQ